MADRERKERTPFAVRLPGFVSDEEVGLGNIIKRATTVAGIRPCGGCGRRADALNRRVVVTPWRAETHAGNVQPWRKAGS